MQSHPARRPNLTIRGSSSPLKVSRLDSFHVGRPRRGIAWEWHVSCYERPCLDHSSPVSLWRRIRPQLLYEFGAIFEKFQSKYTKLSMRLASTYRRDSSIHPTSKLVRGVCFQESFDQLRQSSPSNCQFLLLLLRYFLCRIAITPVENSLYLVSSRCITDC